MGCLPSVQVFPNKDLDLDNMKRVGRNGSTFSDQSSNTLRTSIKFPLTEREVFTITKTWKAISRNMTAAGIAMFLKMFETRSDVKVMFEQFRSVEKADLGTSRALENHALLVMNALDEAIANMDDPDYLIDMLLITGKSHRRFEHFSGDIFWAIEEPFIISARECLGDRWSKTMESIYRRAILFILNTLIIGFKHDFETAGSTAASQGFR